MARLPDSSVVVDDHSTRSVTPARLRSRWERGVMRRGRTPDRRFAYASAIALLALPGPSLAASRGVARTVAATGFAQPYAGTPKYQRYAPTEATGAGQINRPLGSAAADRIARKLGL